MPMKLQFRGARQNEAHEIYALYQSVIGEPFCAWNEYYPSMQEIAADLGANTLYVLTDAERIIGAISIVPQNELDALPFWRHSDGTQREIARVVVAKEYRGNGLAYHMVQKVLPSLQEQGCHTVHLSVSIGNPPAYATYLKAGFVKVGEANLYGGIYQLLEKTL